MKKYIHTPKAPKAIGAYSQAVQVDNTVYVSGQLGLNPETMQMAPDFSSQAKQAFENLKAIAEATGATLQDYVKLNVFLIDLGNFAAFNEIMGQFISEPYPARAAIQISKLPKDGLVEIDGVIGIEK